MYSEIPFNRKQSKDLFKLKYNTELELTTIVNLP